VRDINDASLSGIAGEQHTDGQETRRRAGLSPPKQTIFGAPVKKIRPSKNAPARWEGELIHTRRDGTQVVVASGGPSNGRTGEGLIAILETNKTSRTQAGRGSSTQGAGGSWRMSRVRDSGRVTPILNHEITSPSPRGQQRQGMFALRGGDRSQPGGARQSADAHIADGRRAGRNHQPDSPISSRKLRRVRTG